MEEELSKNPVNCHMIQKENDEESHLETPFLELNE